MFYTFYQNNSGGFFTKPAHYVIVEADSAEEANAIAEQNGVYFDGVEEGIDCRCCGDRWIEIYDDDDCAENPTIYGGLPEVGEDCVIIRKKEQNA